MGTSPVIEPLGSHHDRAAFSCGNEDLDRYFHRLASQDLRRGVAVPFVLIEPTASNIAGFYTLSALSVRIGAFPESITRKLPKYPVMPATLLGRLAVDRQYRGRGYGGLLIMDALRKSLRQSLTIGSIAVVVDAKDEPARSFYQRHDFVAFSNQPRRLFLPMAKIEKLL